MALRQAGLWLLHRLRWWAGCLFRALGAAHSSDCVVSFMVGVFLAAVHEIRKFGILGVGVLGAAIPGQLGRCAIPRFIRRHSSHLGCRLASMVQASAYAQHHRGDSAGGYLCLALSVSYPPLLSLHDSILPLAAVPTVQRRLHKGQGGSVWFGVAWLSDLVGRCVRSGGAGF
ncbi:hypothetical protein D9M70_440700 [compost metagenome]